MADRPLSTVPRRFARAASQFPTRPALSHKPPKSKAWQTLPFADVGEQVRACALGLAARGVDAAERVAILSDNRPEWIIADQAIAAIGAVSVPIYPSLPAVQVQYILDNSGATAVIGENTRQLAKTDGAASVLHRVQMDGEPEGGAVTFTSLLETGRNAPVDDFALRVEAVQPGDLYTIIYTSGTTGSPKGVMLTHANMCATLDGATADLPQYRPPDETMLSFLPLAHIFERVTSTLALSRGAQIYFNDSLLRLMDNLAELRPTVMVNVPRVFESIYDRVLDGVAKLPARRKKLTEWALSIGAQVAERRNAGRLVRPLLGVQFLVADKLVLRKVRARFGGHINFLVTGGAAINPAAERFYFAVGLPLLEIWGLTEVGLATINPQGRARIGSVGRVSRHTQVRVAPDGELLVKGPNVMRGYWNNPDATAEALDADGWFHTGDIGTIDSDGYVKITDRKKDLLVLANGKNVAPQPIEIELRRSPLINEAVLLGDGTGSVSALIVPDFDALRGVLGTKEKDNAALVADADARRAVKKEIDARSQDLADYQKVKRFALLDHTFTIDGGELTPTLKVKRRVVSERYGHLLDRE